MTREKGSGVASGTLRPLITDESAASSEELGIRNEGGGFAEIDDEVAAVLAFVISSATFLAAQDDETGRCPKVPWIAGFPLVVFCHRPFERK